MNSKEIIRTILYMLTALASVAVWIYCHQLSAQLKMQEEKNIQLWAEAIREIEKVDIDGDISQIVYKIIQENNTIPAILQSDQGDLMYINLDTDPEQGEPSEEYLRDEMERMRKVHEPICIDHSYMLYYTDSSILKQLETFPVIQLIVTMVIIVLTIVSIRASNKADQHKIMVGMSKETAHQLGTPITSLLAWVELLKIDNYNPEITQEVEKDVSRLVQVTNRFSQIGNEPEFTLEDIAPILSNSINYLKARTSSNVKYSFHLPESSEIIIPVSVSLFEWVVENICKNAIDSMQGRGKIDISLSQDEQSAIIDISDNGKGIQKRNFKTIFKPGFTTKKHGWGLGLSLAQRIVCDYHKGKLFVKSSEIGEGSTFRIILPKKN